MLQHKREMHKTYIDGDLVDFKISSVWVDKDNPEEIPGVEHHEKITPEEARYIECAMNVLMGIRD